MPFSLPCTFPLPLFFVSTAAAPPANPGDAFLLLAAPPPGRTAAPLAALDARAGLVFGAMGFFTVPEAAAAFDAFALAGFRGRFFGADFTLDFGIVDLSAELLSNRKIAVKYGKRPFLSQAGKPVS